MMSELEMMGFVFIGTLIWLIRLIWLLFWQGKKRLPPGNLGTPLIGETLEWLRSRSRGAHAAAQFYHERAAKYGEVFRTNFVGSSVIVMHSVAGKKLLFCSENKLVTTYWPPRVTRFIGQQSLLSKTGNEAKRIRSALMTFLNPEALQKFVASADVVASRHVSQHWYGKEQVKVYPSMKEYASTLACNLLVTHLDEHERDKLGEAFKIMVEGAARIPINLPGFLYHKALKSRDNLHKQITQWMEQRRHTLNQELVSLQQHDLLSYLLSYRDQDGRPLTDECIRDNIVLGLFTGHDTNATTLTMLCKFLAENPDWFKKVREEQQFVRSRKKSNEALNWEDVKSMKLSWRAIQETLRMQPPAHVGYYKAIEDFEFAGYTIPKGSQVQWNAISDHYNSTFFPEPRNFDPSRFEGAGPAPYTYIPFGGGPRMCPGVEFARLATMVLLHHLVLRVKWRLVDPYEQIPIRIMAFPVKGLPVWVEATTCLSSQ